MTPGDLGMSRMLRWALLAAVLTPIISGGMVALHAPFGDLDTRTLVVLWVEFEVLVLVAVAVIAGHARARSERRRLSAIRRLRRRAVRDPLTSLLNRRGLFSVLSRPKWTEASGGRSALLLDLDNFKRVNDDHGHIIGDRVLLAVADSLLEIATEGWIAARLGGDEFLIIRRGTDPEGAEGRVRAGFKEALERQGLPDVTVSFGAAMDDTGEVPLGDLVARADSDLSRRRGTGGRTQADWGSSPEWANDAGSGLLDLGTDIVQAVSRSLVSSRFDVLRLRRIGFAFAGLALLLSLAALIAVPLDVIWLRTIEQEGALSFTTSLTLAISSAAMLCFFWGRSTSPGRLRVCRFGGWLVAAIGLLAVTEHLTAVTLLPTELVSDPLDGVVSHINRPDLESGLGFVFGGIYTTLLGRRGALAEVFRFVVSLGLIAVVAAAAFGILLGAGYLWQGDAIVLSPQGMLTATLLSVSLLLAEPGQPLMRPFLSGGGAARISNTLVAAGMIIPLLAGTTLVHLESAQGAGWGIAVMVVALVQATILAVLIVSSMRAARRSDREAAELWRKLSEVADRDPLTGLFNRDRFNREVEISRSVLRRNGTPYSIVLLDLDRLKRLNTTRGYAAGDRALQEVAAALQTGVRPSDLPVRLGGDEFGIVLPGAGESEAMWVAQRCSHRIEALGDPGLKVSWGVATADEDIEPNMLMATADRRLYEAKGIASRDLGVNPQGPSR